MASKMSPSSKIQNFTQLHLGYCCSLFLKTEITMSTEVTGNTVLPWEKWCAVILPTCSSSFMEKPSEALSSGYHRETIPSLLTWCLSGRQPAVFQNAKWHLIIQKSPFTIPCFARPTLIYLNVFPFLLTPSFLVHVENKWASNTRFIVLLSLLLPLRIFRWHCYLQNEVPYWDLHESLTSTMTF